MSWRQQTTAKKLRRPRALTKSGAPGQSLLIGKGRSKPF